LPPRPTWRAGSGSGNTAMRAELAVRVRHPGPGDDLAAIWPVLARLHWDSEGVFVAELDGELVGGALVWDAGHDIVHLDELSVRPAWRKQGVGHAIMNAIHDELRQKGRRAVLGWSREPWFVEAAKAAGARVGEPVCVLAWPLTVEFAQEEVDVHRS